MRPPDLQRARELLFAEAAEAFAFLRDEGFELRAPRDDALEVEFRSADRRLVMQLGPRSDPRYRSARVYLGKGGGELWDIDWLAREMPDDIDPAPSPVGGANIDDEADVPAAVRDLADRVRREWLGFLRADIGVFDRFEARVRRRRHEQEQASADAHHAELGRVAFEERDYARAAAELAAASSLSRADAKRLDIARRRS